MTWLSLLGRDARRDCHRCAATDSELSESKSARPGTERGSRKDNEKVTVDDAATVEVAAFSFENNVKGQFISSHRVHHAIGRWPQ